MIKLVVNMYHADCWSGKHYTLPGQKKVTTQKKGHTQYFVGPPLVLIMARIRCGIVLISFCNVTRFISIQCCINFSPRSCIDDGRVWPLRKAFSSTSMANPCVKMMSHAPWTNSLSNSGSWGSAGAYSSSLQEKGRGTPWTGRQSIAGSHID